MNTLKATTKVGKEVDGWEYRDVGQYEHWIKWDDEKDSYIRVDHNYGGNPKGAACFLRKWEYTTDYMDDWREIPSTDMTLEDRLTLACVLARLET